METIDTDGRCGSLTGGEYDGPAAESTTPSKRNSAPAKAKAGTPTADETPNGSEHELSILQTALDRFIETGGKVKTGGQKTVSGTPVVVIQIYGATLCPKCQIWTLSSQCPTAGCEGA